MTEARSALFDVGRQASVPGRLCHFDNAIDVTVVHYRHVDRFAQSYSPEIWTLRVERLHLKL